MKAGDYVFAIFNTELTTGKPRAAQGEFSVIDQGILYLINCLVFFSGGGFEICKWLAIPLTSVILIKPEEKPLTNKR